MIYLYKEPCLLHIISQQLLINFSHQVKRKFRHTYYIIPDIINFGCHIGRVHLCSFYPKFPVETFKLNIILYPISAFYTKISDYNHEIRSPQEILGKKPRRCACPIWHPKLIMSGITYVPKFPFYLRYFGIIVGCFSIESTDRVWNYIINPSTLTQNQQVYS